MTVTYAELQAMAINTDTLPPMVANTGNVVRLDTKRREARRETLARRQARTLKAAA